MIYTLSATLIGFVATLGCAPPLGSTVDIIKVGAKAPDFAAPSTAGKTATLASLTKTGPTYLYFIKEMCSANPRAIKYYNRLFDAYGKKVSFVGVINAGADGHKSWQKQFGGTYASLLDPDKKIIKSYGIVSSQYVVMVGIDGKVAKVFNGFGIDSLKALNASMAATAKMKLANVDLSGAPTGMAFG